MTVHRNVAPSAFARIDIAPDFPGGTIVLTRKTRVRMMRMRMRMMTGQQFGSTFQKVGRPFRFGTVFFFPFHLDSKFFLNFVCLFKCRVPTQKIKWFPDSYFCVSLFLSFCFVTFFFYTQTSNKYLNFVIIICAFFSSFFVIFFFPFVLVEFVFFGLDLILSFDFTFNLK